MAVQTFETRDKSIEALKRAWVAKQSNKTKKISGLISMVGTRNNDKPIDNKLIPYAYFPHPYPKRYS